MILLLSCKSNPAPHAIKMQLTMSVQIETYIYTRTYVHVHIYVHVCASVYMYVCVDMYMCVDIMYQCKRCIYSFHAAECVTLQFINT